ncbi:MAG: hypothetical protein J2P56_04890, partial [Verrucomicrobia bacterium]|nr:hypothetical protein [Verrucomicrobiota bacterium]
MRTAKMIPAPRQLSDNERLLIEWLLRHGEVAASDYLQQLPYTSVASHCDCGCPTIGLAVSANAPRISQPTGIIADVRAVTPEGGDVGMMVHASDGNLEELEVYPIGATPATFSLPH